MLTRRELLALGSIGLLTLALTQRRRTGDGRLSARLASPTMKIGPGEHALGLGGDRDGVLIVPKGYSPNTPAALALMLHGAGGSGRRVSSLFSVAAELGVIVLAPESRSGTWDAIASGYGPDVAFLNRALEHTFARCAIDARRVAIGGFSDGATYGLSIGLASADLFTHILACSPGFIIPGTTPSSGRRPKIFISHGTADQILPIDETSRRIVPALERASFAVKYREFNGPHRVPPEIAREAFEWFLQAA